MAAPEASRAGASSWRVLRASDWWYFALLPAATLDTGAPAAICALRLGRGVLAAAAALGFAYGLNAIHDRATDRSATKNPLAGARAVPARTKALVGLAGAVALATAATAGAQAALCAAISLGSSAVYSAGPRVKRYPVLGTAANVAIFLPLLWLDGAGALRSLSLPLGFTALLLQNQLWHERQDLDEDRDAGVRSSASLLGARGTAATAGVIGALGAAAVALALPGARLVEVVAACAACAAGSLAPLCASPARARTVHRVTAIAGGALLFAASLSASLSASPTASMVRP
jgi:4-hydroxybenzoate polyprenyltransferase